VVPVPKIVACCEFADSKIPSPIVATFAFVDVAVIELSVALVTTILIPSDVEAIVLAWTLRTAPAIIVPVLACPAVNEVALPLETVVAKEVEVSATQPLDVPVPSVVLVTAAAVPIGASISSINEPAVWVVPRVPRTAFATGADTTVNIPAVRADTATSAIRCLIVFIDICILSLVRLRIS
jgi:hypothetical protein